jgi:hypothetical protein
MRRREAVTLLAGAAAWPLAATGTSSIRVLKDATATTPIVGRSAIE